MPRVGASAIVVMKSNQKRPMIEACQRAKIRPLISFMAYDTLGPAFQ